MTDTVPRNTTQGPAAPYRLPRYEEMPDILLYMDQVLSLMERYLSGLHVDPKTLTASMVNNYVKMGAVPSPEKKKYGREHLCHLMMICLLKSVMPIPSITALIVQGKERRNTRTYIGRNRHDESRRFTVPGEYIQSHGSSGGYHHELRTGNRFSEYRSGRRRYGTSDRKTRTDTGFSAVSDKPCYQQEQI